MKCGHYRLSIKPTETRDHDEDRGLELLGACFLIVLAILAGILL